MAAGRHLAVVDRELNLAAAGLNCLYGTTNRGAKDRLQLPGQVLSAEIIERRTFRLGNVRLEAIDLGLPFATREVS